MTRLVQAILVGLAILTAGIGRAQYLEATIRVNFRPNGILWTPTSNKVYVSSAYDENVVILDAATLQPRTALEMGDQPNSMCWNSVNNKLYVATCDNNRVVVVDCYGDSVITTLRVPGAPVPMAYNSTLNKLYVGATENGYVSVFDAQTDTLLRRIHVDNSHVRALLWHPSTNRVFCTTPSDSVKVIDCVSDVIVSTLVAAAEAWELTRNQANGLVYVACRNEVLALAPSGDSAVAVIPARMYYACAVPYPNKLYGGNPVIGEDDIYVLDCASHTVTDSIACRIWQLQMVCDTVGDRVYAVGFQDSVVAVIDPRVDSVVVEMPLGRNPSALTWDWLDNRVFVANGMDTTVSVIRTNVGIYEGSRPVALDRGWTIAVRNGVLEWRAQGQLLDLSGRVVTRLRPGSNQLPDHAPGVYFARRADESRVIKVVVMQ